MAQALPDIQGLVPHRACRNCVQIKVKCIPQADSSDSICQRCRRLNKACTTPVPATRKRPRSKVSKVAQLEDRINRLSTLLTPTQTNSESSEGSPQEHFTAKTAPSNASSGAYSHRLVEQSVTDQRARTTSSVPPTTHSGASSGYPCLEEDATSQQDVRLAHVFAPPHLTAWPKSVLMAPAEICPVFLEPETERVLFQRFRTEMLPFNPFVTVSPLTEVNSLKRDNPFLYWAGCAVASFHTRLLNKKLHDELIKCISEHMLSKAHRSLDLLQGILVIIAWFHYYGHNNPCLVSLLHLAQALTVDLGFNRPSYARDRAKIVVDTAEIYHGHRVIDGIQTLEQRRAFLGVYYWGSKMALCTGRLEAPRFTMHIERCCQDLQAAREVPSDEYLVTMVQLYRLMENCQVYQLASSGVPLRLYMSMFQDALRTFQQTLPRDMRSSKFVQLEINCCKASFYGSPYLRDDKDTAAVMEALHSALTVFTELTDTFSSFSPVDICHITFGNWFVMTNATAIFGELSFLKIDGWDLTWIQEKFQFPIFVQKIIEIFGRVKEYAQARSLDELVWRFEMYAEKFKRCIKWHETRMGMKEKGEAERSKEGADALPDTFTASMFDGFDDALWQDLMGDWTNF